MVAPWDSRETITTLADRADVVTLEFENVPLDTLRELEKQVSVRPGPKSLEIAQDRLLEKTFANQLGIATAPYFDVDSAAQLEAASQEIGGPGILKTRRLGYDGKGQVRVDHPEQAASAWQQLGGAPCILEGHVPFERELSVIVARSQSGDNRAFDVVENRHEDHILCRTIAPAKISQDVAQRAVDAGSRLATALDLVGLLAVELFLLPDETLLVNEIAPRPHNSGHWTIDACHVSQFEQLVRAVVDLPLGDVERHSDAEMVNLLGDEAAAIGPEFSRSGTCVHLYGKAEARLGRKMGHITHLRRRS